MKVLKSHDRDRGEREVAGIFLRWASLEGVEVYDSRLSEYVVNAVKRAVEEVRSSLTLEGLKDHPVIRAYRTSTGVWG